MTQQGYSAAQVRTVMDGLDRSRFLPSEQQRFAAFDRPLPIGRGQTNSQPSTVAAMIGLLALSPGMRVLDIGCGTGWSTEILAELTGPEGSVDAVERIAELGARARRLLADRPTVRVHQARDGVFGLPDAAPFDRILVSAAAPHLPEELIDQLVPGGILVIPVQHTMLRVKRLVQGGHHVTEHGSYAFVPLIRAGDSRRSVRGTD